MFFLFIRILFFSKNATYFVIDHAQKMKLKDFNIKRDQIRSFLRIWSHLLKKSLTDNFFWAVFVNKFHNTISDNQGRNTLSQIQKIKQRLKGHLILKSQKLKSWACMWVKSSLINHLTWGTESGKMGKSKGIWNFQNLR